MSYNHHATNWQGRNNIHFHVIIIPFTFIETIREPCLPAPDMDNR